MSDLTDMAGVTEMADRELEKLQAREEAKRRLDEKNPFK